jgi:glycosyltransferase involved in cell wall biosynthesis
MMILAAKYKKQMLEEMVKFFPEEWEIRICDIDICRRYSKKEDHLLSLSWPVRSVVHRLPNHLFWDEVIAFKPDIIYTDHITYVGWYAKMIRSITGMKFKIVYHLRGHWFIEYWKNVLKSGIRYLLSIPLIYPATLVGFNECDAFVPICRWLDKDLLSTRYPTKPSFVLHQGINPDLFYKDLDDVFDYKHPCVGIMQSFDIYDKVQGILDFVSVIKSMKHVHFYLSGSGLYKNKVTIALRLCDNVTFVGSMKYPNDVRKFYNSVDVFALPTGLDCCPTTVLESGLCERPVCASNIGGIPEILIDGKNGFLINDPDGWTRHIQSLIDDKELTERIGKDARKFVESKFAWKILSPKIAAFLKGLVK